MNSKKTYLRKQARNHYKIVGILMKLRNNKFSIFDESSTRSYKISNREIYKAFPGDEVECSITTRGWAVIEKIISSNTKDFIGKVIKSGNHYKAIPVGLGRYSAIKIQGKIPKTELKNNIAKIILSSQANKNRSAKGFISYFFNEDDLERKANEIAISKFQLRTNWGKSIIRELKKIIKEVKKNKNQREDLTDKSFVTIDGKNAKDFDDAVYAEKDTKGNFNLYVAIADVSHYVKLNSSIDNEARKRGTSIYFHKKVIPMLPEKISNELCSLSPNEDKDCLVCKIKLNKKGNIIDALFFEAKINSKARLTYEKISSSFERNNFNNLYSDSLENINTIFKLLKLNKEKRGALELDVPSKIPLFKKGKVTKFVVTDRNKAQMVIEECMLVANICAAELLKESMLPSIFRVHPKPESTKVADLENFLRTKGFNINLKGNIKVEDFSKVISLTKSKEERETISMQILQSLSLACYSSKGSGHFALAYKAYTHFTSPIRRYPDLVVHRTIKSLIKESGNGFISIKKIKNKRPKIKENSYDQIELEKISAEASHSERIAEKATRDSIDTLKCECALNNLGNNFIGRVSSVTDFGLFVLLEDLNIEGLCHVKHFPKRGFYEFEAASKSLVNRNSGHSYQIGDRLSVIINRVDVLSHQIDLKINK